MPSARETGMIKKIIAVFALIAPVISHAGEVDVVGARATQSSNGTWRFDVTLKHADEGWDHYANKWEVVAPDGTNLATRVLAHPHVDEQPFTRSLGNVKIDSAIKIVTIRGGDLVHDTGGVEMELPVN